MSPEAFISEISPPVCKVLEKVAAPVEAIVSFTVLPVIKDKLPFAVFPVTPIT
jgi:hypothetical protein